LLTFAWASKRDPPVSQVGEPLFSPYLYNSFCFLLYLHLNLGPCAQALYLSSHFLSPFSFTLVLRSRIFVQAVLDHNPPMYAFSVAGMTGIRHHSQLIGLDRVRRGGGNLANFFICPGASNLKPPDLCLLSSWVYRYKLLCLAYS
jgi:hypothetical protein